MTDEQVRQRLSFAYGNLAMSNPDTDWKDVALAFIREAEASAVAEAFRDPDVWMQQYADHVRDAVETAEKATRERCAAVADGLALDWGRLVGCSGYADGASFVAERIRGADRG